MGFLSLSALWLLLLIPPLVLLYFLKLKRPRLAVPSLILWQQVVNDSRVNSPFQRFKRNILLLIQLLLLLLLILAAMQPFWRGAASSADQLPILIDRSASMAAVDSNGKSRLDIAKKQVRDMIEGLSPNEELAIIAFSKSATQLSGFTSNKRVLLDAIDSIKIEDVPSDLSEALRMADAMARSNVFNRVLLISDGNFPQQIEFQLPFKLDYQKLPAAGANIGITSLNARRASNEGWSVFVSVQATEDNKAPATLELVQDGEVRATERVAPTTGRAQRVMFTINTDKHTSIEVRLRPDGSDSLPGDNEAFLELSPLRPLWVYVPKTMDTFRTALIGIDQVRLFPGLDDAGVMEDYDLIISNSEEDPKGSNWASALYVGIVPKDLEHLLEIAPKQTAVIDWRRANSLLEHVQFSELIILDQPRYRQIQRESTSGIGEDTKTITTTDMAKESDLENLHYEVIAHGQHGPLILQKREGEKLSFYLLFDPDRSTLPYRVGFPIMLSNLVRASMHQSGLLEVVGDSTGVLPAMTLTPKAKYNITGPHQYDRHESADDKGVVSGVPAPRVGRYSLKTGGKESFVGVSLLNLEETLLESVDTIRFADPETSVIASTRVAETNKSLWSTFALLALMLLLVEWWFFQRKPGGFTR